MRTEPSYDDHLAQLEHERDRAISASLSTCEWCRAEEVETEWSADVDMNICDDCRPPARWYGGVAGNVRLLQSMAEGKEIQDAISAADVASTILEMVREHIEL